MTEPALFDIEPDTQRVAVDTPCVDELDLQADDSAWASCRHCQTLTTAAGIRGRARGCSPGRRRREARAS